MSYQHPNISSSVILGSQQPSPRSCGLFENLFCLERQNQIPFGSSIQQMLGNLCQVVSYTEYGSFLHYEIPAHDQKFGALLEKVNQPDTKKGLKEFFSWIRGKNFHTEIYGSLVQCVFWRGDFNTSDLDLKVTLGSFAEFSILAKKVVTAGSGWFIGAQRSGYFLSIYYQPRGKKLLDVTFYANGVKHEFDPGCVSLGIEESLDKKSFFVSPVVRWASGIQYFHAHPQSFASIHSTVVHTLSGVFCSASANCSQKALIRAFDYLVHYNACIEHPFTGTLKNHIDWLSRVAHRLSSIGKPSSASEMREYHGNEMRGWAEKRGIDSSSSTFFARLSESLLSMVDSSFGFERIENFFSYPDTMPIEQCLAAFVVTLYTVYDLKYSNPGSITKQFDVTDENTNGLRVKLEAQDGTATFKLYRSLRQVYMASDLFRRSAPKLFHRVCYDLYRFETKESARIFPFPLKTSWFQEIVMNSAAPAGEQVPSEARG